MIEGKAALTTSFQLFKFIELYAVIMTTSCTILFIIGSNITDMQFLYVDLIALVPLSVMQAWTGSYHKLTKDMPTSTLFYFPVILSVCVSSLIQIAFQLFFFLNIRSQPFFVPLDPRGEQWSDADLSYEETVLFMIVNFQLIMTSLAFSISEPFVLSFCSIFVFNSMIILLPDTSFVSKWFDLLPFRS